MDQDLEVEAQNVVADDDVRVKLLDARQEQTQQLTLGPSLLNLYQDCYSMCYCCLRFFVQKSTEKKEN